MQSSWKRYHCFSRCNSGTNSCIGFIFQWKAKERQKIRIFNFSHFCLTYIAFWLCFVKTFLFFFQSCTFSQILSHLSLCPLMPTKWKNKRKEKKEAILCWSYLLLLLLFSLVSSHLSSFSIFSASSSESPPWNASKFHGTQLEVSAPAHTRQTDMSKEDA